MTDRNNLKVLRLPWVQDAQHPIKGYDAEHLLRAIIE